MSGVATAAPRYPAIALRRSLASSLPWRGENLAHNATLWGARSQARNRYLLETYAN